MSKAKTKQATPANAAPRAPLVLSPSIWRSQLRAELIAAGITHDTASLVGRRVLSSLVSHYLTGQGEAHSPSAPPDEPEPSIYDVL